MWLILNTNGIFGISSNPKLALYEEFKVGERKKRGKDGAVLCILALLLRLIAPAHGCTYQLYSIKSMFTIMVFSLSC